MCKSLLGTGVRKRYLAILSISILSKIHVNTAAVLADRGLSS